MKQNCIIIFGFIILLGCASTNEYEFKIDAINSSIKFPAKPEIIHSDNGQINLTYSNTELTYCVEFKPFETKFSVDEYFNGKNKVDIDASEDHRKCTNLSKTIFGIDTVASNSLAGIANFQNRVDGILSTNYYQVTENWKLSMTIGLINSNLTFEQRENLRDNFFSTDATNPLYKQLSERMNAGFVAYNIEEKWR